MSWDFIVGVLGVTVFVVNNRVKSRPCIPCYDFENIPINTTMANITKAIAIEIQRGDNTHSQDQSILPMSLRTMNTMAKRPQKPIPDPEFDELLLIDLLFLLFITCTLSIWVRYLIELSLMYLKSDNTVSFVYFQ